MERNARGEEKQRGTNRAWQDGDLQMRWRDLFEGTTRDFHSPSHSFFYCFMELFLLFSGQTSRGCKRGTRWETLPIIPVRTPRKCPTHSYSFTCKTRAGSYGTRRVRPRPEGNGLFPKACDDFSEFLKLPPPPLAPAQRTRGQAVGLRGGTPARRGAGDQLLSTHLLVLAGSSEPQAVLAELANVLEHGPERGSSLGTGRNNQREGGSVPSPPRSTLSMLRSSAIDSGSQSFISGRPSGERHVYDDGPGEPVRTQARPDHPTLRGDFIGATPAHSLIPNPDHTYLDRSQVRSPSLA